MSKLKVTSKSNSVPSSKPQAKNSTYNIRQVIELTGISEFSLRGWESRYKAVAPTRTASGRRQYSRQDILKIRALLDLTSRGYRIGEIADLHLEQLQKKVENHSEQNLVQHLVQTSDQILINKMIRSADSFNWDLTEKIFLDRKKNSTPQSYVHDFLIPLINLMNRQVELNQFSVTQEHILSAMIKESLYSVSATALSFSGATQTPPQSQKKTKSITKEIRLVLATPEGDYHEIGILIASTLAALTKVHRLYLGPNVPKTELCEAALRYGATHVLVSSTISNLEGAKDDFLNYINFIDRQLAPSIHVWLAGRSAYNTPVSLKRPSEVLTTIKDFENKLTRNYQTRK